MAKPKRPTTSQATHPSAQLKDPSSLPLAAWESSGTCNICAKKISHGRYCKACAETQVHLEFCTSCGKLVRGKELCKQCAQEKAEVVKTLPKTIDDWSSLTSEQKSAFNESKEDHRLTPRARRQRSVATVLTYIMLLVSLAAGALLFNGLVNAPKSPLDISGQSVGTSIESESPTKNPIALVNVTLPGVGASTQSYYLDGRYSVVISIEHSSEQCLLALYARGPGESIGSTIYAGMVFGNSGTFPDYSQTFNWDSLYFLEENVRIVSESACEKVRLQLRRE